MRLIKTFGSSLANWFRTCFEVLDDASCQPTALAQCHRLWHQLGASHQPPSVSSRFSAVWEPDANALRLIKPQSRRHWALATGSFARPLTHPGPRLATAAHILKHALWILPLCLINVWSVAAAQKPGSAAYDRAADKHNFTVFMTEGGWCWYQDPRAIIQDGKLFMGSVQGNGSGPALVGVYDLHQKKPLGTAVMHDHFQGDDHNAPVFYARSDGSVLAVYALHGKNKTHYYRVADARAPLKWSEEMAYVHKYPHAGNVTYMNLCPLAKAGKLYNFFRGIEFNPSFITSSDNGVTWGEPTHFIRSELEGRHRPYARYAGNSADTVHVSFTDGHPRQFGNSIYYAAFRDGKFYRANGELIKELKQDGPLSPSEAELVFKGSGESGRGDSLSARESAWTSSIVFDDRGHPHIGYTLYLSNTDHRYRIASWDGTKWIDREVAHAGKCLYDRESSYTGLITLDSLAPTHVVISTDVDPATGKDLGGKHEIYRAHVAANDDVSTISWQPITNRSPVRNLRPVIVSTTGYRIILWLRGDYQILYQLSARRGWPCGRSKIMNPCCHARQRETF